MRSTFAAELLALSASVDQAFVILTTLHELTSGSLNASDSVCLRETGGYCLDLHIWIDAKSVFSAVENENFKYPTEKSLLSLSFFMGQATGNPQDHHYPRMG